MINSQQGDTGPKGDHSISKGMGDQFSAGGVECAVDCQYIKGDG